MSLTWQELIDRAVDQASVGLDPNLSPLIDLGMLAENLAPDVLQTVAEEAAQNSETRADLLSSQSISFTNGIGTVPNNVLIDYMADATLSDTSDYSKRYSYRPWHNFVNSGGDRRLGRFSSLGTSLYVVEPAASYTSGSGITASRTLTAPTVPAIPTLATDTITMPEVMTSNVIRELGLRIRGEYDSRTKAVT